MSNVLKIVVILATFILTWRFSYSVTYKLTNVNCASHNKSWVTINEFSNINHTCPYYGDILIRGMYLRTEIKAIPYPSGKYMLQMNWKFYQKLQLVTNVSYDFIENLL
ncbi:uncharacterized protein LOC116801308 [Drosophila sechellia]|uniref:uncharacterized protein LOC116801308 n=1 Tax=Drosophila sechellia TaxID=7238 RepID=UPI0013DE73A7|nr:uncharacterized protein LOC116801308 [Drosophila sechellia]